VASRPTMQGVTTPHREGCGQPRSSHGRQLANDAECLVGPGRSPLVASALGSGPDHLGASRSPVSARQPEVRPGWTWGVQRDRLAYARVAWSPHEGAPAIGDEQVCRHIDSFLPLFANTEGSTRANSDASSVANSMVRPAALRRVKRSSGITVRRLGAKHLSVALATGR
jgi:hypothetical protein